MATVIIPVQELNVRAYFEQPEKIQILRSQIWWNSSYSCRRNTAITAPPDGLSKNHPISIFIPRDIYDNGKVQADTASNFKDLEVLYLVSEIPDVWRRLPRVVERVSGYYRVRFLLQEDLAGNSVTNEYYIYYSNPFKTTDYSTGSPYTYNISELDWPLEVLFSNGLISYTRPGEHWNAGESTTAEAKAAFQFYGPQIRVIMDKGPSFGIVEVQVDSNAWEKVDLYNSTLSENAIVFSKAQLGEGSHTIRVKVTGQKNPASSSANVKLRSFQLKKHSVALDLKEEQYSAYSWSGRIAGD
jgi:hypothetical protein